MPCCDALTRLFSPRAADPEREPAPQTAAATAVATEEEIRDAVGEVTIRWGLYNRDVTVIIARFARGGWTQRLRAIVLDDSYARADPAAAEASPCQALQPHGAEPRAIQKSLAALEQNVLCRNDLKCISFYYFNESQNKIIGLTREHIRWLLEGLPQHAMFDRSNTNMRFDEVRWIFATYTPELTCADVTFAFDRLPRLERIWFHPDVIIEPAVRRRFRPTRQSIGRPLATKDSVRGGSLPGARTERQQ